MSIIEWKSSKTKGVKQEATVDYQGGELLWCIRKSPSGQNYQVFLGDSSNAMYTRSSMSEVKELVYAFCFTAPQNG
tara:strand:+ start:533 stop:760 length:228 start_codon:yes stop_codon:yes gene_type:complete